tara:strand:- start:7849 stop:8094 length:246 start_codon:yes stop_codon:yes gene_type:complete
MIFLCFPIRSFRFDPSDTFLQKIGLIITKPVNQREKLPLQAYRAAHILELRYFLTEEFSKDIKKKASTREASNFQLSRIFW